MTVSKLLVVPFIILPYALSYGWATLPRENFLPLGIGASLLGALFLRTKSYFPAASLIVCAAALFLKNPLPAVFYPAVLSALAAWTFLRTLGEGEVPLIEQIARRKRSDLPEIAVKYCRVVTIIWGGALVINTVVSVSSWLVSESFWRIYNGVIFYAILLLLFTLEFAARCVMRARFAHRD